VKFPDALLKRTHKHACVPILSLMCNGKRAYVQVSRSNLESHIIANALIEDVDHFRKADLSGLTLRAKDSLVYIVLVHFAHRHTRCSFKLYGKSPVLL
jgi:hypothetical protein